jgi:hypothetical protein
MVGITVTAFMAALGLHAVLAQARTLPASANTTVPAVDPFVFNVTVYLVIAYATCFSSLVLAVFSFVMTRGHRDTSSCSLSVIVEDMRAIQDRFVLPSVAPGAEVATSPLVQNLASASPASASPPAAEASSTGQPAAPS